MLKGIDISRWQGTPDFDILKGQIDFLIIKATEGTGFIDPSYSYNRDNARRVGLGLGYYHFARPDLGNSPESEADYFCNAISDIREGEVVALDYEANWEGDVVAWCKGFLDRVASRFDGLKGVIYINKSTQKGYDWSSVINSDYGLWLADYDGNGDSAPWPVIAFQQTGSQGLVTGISGNIDTDVFAGDEATFKKYGFQGQSQPTPEPSQLNATDLANQIVARLQQVANDPSQNDSLARLNGLIGINDWPTFVTELVDRASWALGSGKDKQIASLNDLVSASNDNIKDLNQKLVDSDKKYGDMFKELAPNVQAANDLNRLMGTQKIQIDNLNKELDDYKISYRALQDKLGVVQYDTTPSPVAPSQSSSDKPFYNSKKFIAWASQILVILPSIVAFFPQSIQPYLIGATSVLTIVYTFVQGNIDFQETSNRIYRVIKDFQTEKKVSTDKVQL